MIKGSFIIVICLNVVYSSNLHKTEAKAKHGDDCSLFNWCEADLKCHDYRCLNETELQNATELPRAPEGNVCDWFHHCKDGFHCESHRCAADNGTNITSSGVVGDNQSEKNESKLYTEGTGNQTVNDTEIKPQARKEGENAVKEDISVNETESQKDESVNEEEQIKIVNETNVEHHKQDKEDKEEQQQQQQPIEEQHRIKDANDNNNNINEAIQSRTMIKHKTPLDNNEQQNNNSTNISEEK
jgi:hypothetical protein